jgi:cytochrome c-type biogenesis protein
MTAMLFAYLAGLLSILSPCVLPLVPIVLTTAMSKHRFGPAALAAGVTLSFVAIGMFVALVGFGIGLDFTFFRLTAGALMLTLGAVLLSPPLQARFSVLAGPVSNWTEQRFGGQEREGLGGQFGIGLLLGAVWSPCVGPTLGAASIMAAKGDNLGEVFATMMAFGIGAASPLLLLGILSRDAVTRWRDRMLKVGKGGKFVLGMVLVAIGLLVTTGLDKYVEALLVEISPEWLTGLTTRF